MGENKSNEQITQCVVVSENKNKCQVDVTVHKIKRLVEQNQHLLVEENTGQDTLYQYDHDRRTTPQDKQREKDRMGTKPELKWRIVRIPESTASNREKSGTDAKSIKHSNAPPPPSLLTDHGHRI